MRSQFATSSLHGGRRYAPRVFTEHGALMAANVLNSKRAVEMSVFVVRAFTRMRSALSDTHELARKLATLEREVKSRLDSHDAAIVDVMQRILDLIDPPERPEPPPPPQRKIGFSVKEPRANFRAQSGRGGRFAVSFFVPAGAGISLAFSLPCMRLASSAARSAPICW